MSSEQLSSDPQELDLLRVARIGRAQGLKGEVSVWCFTDEPEERFSPDAELYTADGDTCYVVQRSRTFKKRWYIKLEGVDNRTDAEALQGLELYAIAWDRDEMLEQDEFYPKDLIGLEVKLVPNNCLGKSEDEVIGKVVDMIEGAQWLLKIKLTNNEKALVPFVKALVPEIDLNNKTLIINPPGGLIEL